MGDDKLNSLYRERTRLLDAWRNAGEGNKMSILIRIDDIDEQIMFIKESQGKTINDEQPRLRRDS
jgi:cystathionine beta-lyase family protein involved in aluminum resistance